MNGEQEIFGPLRKDLKLIVGNGDGKILLFDPLTDRYYSLDAPTVAVAKALAVSRTLAELKTMPDVGEYSDRELKKALLFLKLSGLLELTTGESVKMALLGRAKKRAMWWKQILSSYLCLQIPLLNPDRFLTKTLPLAKFFLHPLALMIFIAGAIVGYLNLFRYGAALGESFLRSLTFTGVGGYLFAAVIVKIIHELAHAYTAKKYDVPVRRFGIGFIVFFPRLYTDVTDLWRISDRKIRMAVDGAGIFTELVIGGWAALVWSIAPPGGGKVVAFYLFAVGAMGTLLVNGNPLIKYDGYFFLMDFLGIDNLQQRARCAFRSLWYRLVGLSMPDEEQQQGGALVIYAICSFFYRLFLYTAIIFIVYHKFTKVIGIVLFALEVFLLIIFPLHTELKLLKRASWRPGRKIPALIVLCFLAALCLLPLPWPARLPMEVISEETEYVIVREGGYLEQILPDGATVHVGEPVFSSSNVELTTANAQANVAVKSAELTLAQSQRTAQRRSEEAVWKLRLANAREEAQYTETQLERLTYRSSINGTFVRVADVLPQNGFLRPNTLLGIIYGGQRILRVYASETVLPLLSPGMIGKAVLAKGTELVSGTIESISEVPCEFNHSPLLDGYGGPIATNPAVTGIKGNVTLDKWYELKVTIDQKWNGDPGQSGWLTVCVWRSLAIDGIRKFFIALQREFSF